MRLSAPADLLLVTLGADDAQVDYLGTILQRLVVVNPLLQAWASQGAPSFGLAELVQALSDDPAFVRSMPIRLTQEPVMSSFRGQAQTHYLYMSWILRDPIDHTVIPWADALRAWLLIQALERATGPEQSLADGLLEETCLRLRIACEENDDIRWLHAVRQLTAPTRDWWMLRRHLRSAAEGLQAAHLDSLPDADRLPWLRTISRIARGESRAIGAATRTDIAALARRTTNLALLASPPDWVLPSSQDDELPPVLSISLGDDPEDAEDQGLELLEVDPEASAAVQEQSGRYIQLLSGADARYLPWDRSGLTPPERLALDAFCQQSLHSKDLPARLMAAMVKVARSLGRSLDLTSRLGVVWDADDARTNDWQIELGQGIAVRRAPRRAGHWRPSSEQAAQIRAFSDRLSIALPADVIHVLRAAWSVRKHARRLADLWAEIGEDTLGSSFAKWRSAEPQLRRITQGMLSHVLGQDVFARTRDHVLARLVSSSADSGLPAATAYVAYLASQVIGSESGVAGSPETNVAGGLLDPIDAYLHDRFSKAHQELIRLSRSGDFLTFHNEVTRYWDAAWRAATGIRPHAKRWGSLSDMEGDGSLCFAYVDDKPSLQDRRARLVPVPEALWTRFRDGYISRHLATLRRWIASKSGSPGNEIFEGDALAPTAPMLFLLNSTGEGLQVVLVGASLSKPEPIEGPLPANVYRHRLRTALHRSGADVEVIDSVLGHLDGATATHGDYSMRTWSDDAASILPHLERAFDALGIEYPPDFECDDTLGLAAPPPAWTMLPSKAETRYAEQSRSRQQRRLKIRAVRSARVLIASELKLDSTPSARASAGFSATELVAALAPINDVDRLDRLGTRLMRSETGAPTTLGPLRYGYFVELVDRVWEEHDRRLPLRRRFLRRPRDDSPFQRTAPGARQRRNEITLLLADAVETLTPSKLTATDALWLALFDLAIFNRNVDPELRHALLGRRPFRLVTLGDEYFLEWNADGDIGQIASPVQRMRILNRTAHALAIVLTGEATMVTSDTLPTKRFELIARSCLNDKSEAPTLGRVFANLAHVIDQCNAIELPSMIAAYLAGRIRSTSLHWGEWVELKTGVPRDVRNVTLHPERIDRDPSEDRPRLLRLNVSGIQESNPSEPEQAGASAARSLRGGARVGAQIGSQLAARNFVRELRKILDSAGRRDQTSAVADRRRTARREIEALVRQKSGSTSSAMLLLGQWSASHLDRRRARKLVAVSTVERYLGALAPRFIALAHDRDLLSMDDEEIEELYASLIDLSFLGKARYPYARLRELHAFAEREFGMPSIDWSGVVPDQETKLCAPGFVDEATYRRILIALRYSPSFDTWEERVSAMALVILAYRFGLRGGEAIGLTISDLHFDDSPPWLAVERNRARDLKSVAARRTVPLLHGIRPLEQRTVEHTLGAARRAATGLDGPGYLFPDPAHPGRAIDGSDIKRRVNAAIKAVSGKPYLSLHHLRHSLASRAWWELEGWRINSSDQQASVKQSLRLDSTRRTLLGEAAPTPTRRAPWALARLMGHSHPRVSLFSYVHVLGEAADRYMCDAPGKEWPTLSEKRKYASCVLNVSTLPIAPSRPKRLSLPRHDLGANDVLGILVDLDRGIAPELLSARYAAERAVVERFAGICDRVRRHLRRFEGPRRATPTASDGIMSHVLTSAYPRLRQQLVKLYANEARARIEAICITDAEYVGMFGSNRNISMFRMAQFRLVREILLILDVPVDQMRINLPVGISIEIRDRAIQTGWLFDSRSLRSRSESFGLHPDDVVEQDSAVFQGEPVSQRVIFSLARRASASVSNRWEFICVLLAVIPLIHLESERN